MNALSLDFPLPTRLPDLESQADVCYIPRDGQELASVRRKASCREDKDWEEEMRESLFPTVLEFPHIARFAWKDHVVTRKAYSRF